MKRIIWPGSWRILQVNPIRRNSGNLFSWMIILPMALQRILASLVEGNKQVRQLSLPHGMTGKKRALAFGIEHARHDRIIQVDADCHMGPGFIASHVSLPGEASFRSGGRDSQHRGRGREGFWRALSGWISLPLAGSGAGSFSLGRPMMCSGANLFYSRELYLETRAFDPESSIASGDDMFLMIGARKLGKTLSFNTRQGSNGV